MIRLFSREIILINNILVNDILDDRKNRTLLMKGNMEIKT